MCYCVSMTSVSGWLPGIKALEAVGANGGVGGALET